MPLTMSKDLLKREISKEIGRWSDVSSDRAAEKELDQVAEERCAGCRTEAFDIRVAIEAGGREFQLYESRVFTGRCGTELDHAALARWATGRRRTVAVLRTMFLEERGFSIIMRIIIFSRQKN